MVQAFADGVKSFCEFEGEEAQVLSLSSAL